MSILNFLTPQALQVHMTENHETNPGAVERQCSLCEFTSDSISKLAEHNQSVHHPYGCKICFLHFSAEYRLEDHRLAVHEVISLGTSVDAGDQGIQLPELQYLKMVEPLSRSHPGKRATSRQSCQHH